MDILYHAVRLALENKLFYAPIEIPTAILDIGTGTGKVKECRRMNANLADSVRRKGIWAMDVGKELAVGQGCCGSVYLTTHSR